VPAEYNLILALFKQNPELVVEGILLSVTTHLATRECTNFLLLARA